MRKVWCIAGIIAGSLMALTGVTHSLFGWPELRAAFEKANVPADLLEGLLVPWHLAGLGMSVFGLIVVWFFVQAWKRRAASSFPALLVSGAYALFGIWGLIAVRPDPFFAMFLVPGALAFAAAWMSTRPTADR